MTYRSPSLMTHDIGNPVGLRGAQLAKHHDCKQTDRQTDGVAQRSDACSSISGCDDVVDDGLSEQRYSHLRSVLPLASHHGSTDLHPTRKRAAPSQKSHLCAS